MRRITIKDIASKAGVSAATVSMVMNGNTKISQPTRDKILNIAEELNYVPNVAARGLVGSKTHNVGIIISDMGEPINATTVREFSRVISASEYELVLYETFEETDWRQRLYNQISSEGRVDGIIHKAFDMVDSDRDLVERFRLPLVVFENELPWIDCVAIDNVKGIVSAVKYLLQKGYKSFGVIGCETAADVIQVRASTVKKMLKEAGLSLRPEYIYETVRYSPTEGKRAANYFHGLSERPTAILCIAGDYIACGFLSRMKKLGYHFPEDMAIVGFDDLWFSEFMEPQLTTIRQPLDEMVEAAFQLLVSRIANPDRPFEIKKFDVDLVIRQSA